MPLTEAQKRAKRKYQHDKVKTITLPFYPSESELWEHIQKQPVKAAYLKSLVRADMERSTEG